MSHESPEKPGSAREETEEAWEEKIDYYLENLGLTRADIHGEVVDIGGYEGEFAALVKANGLPAHVRIVEPTHETAYPELAIDYVREKGEHMPGIESESADLVVAHASVPNIYKDIDNAHMKEDIQRALEEAVRVLRKGGRARFAPLIFYNEYPVERAFNEAVEESVARLNQKDGIRSALVRNGNDVAFDTETRAEITVPKFYLSIEKQK